MGMRRLIAGGILVVGLATGCATAPPRPSVHAYPAPGQSAGTMAGDTADCEAWAKHQTGFDPVAETTRGALVGTLLGGALGAGGGAALGAASGGDVGRGAATGAVVGGMIGGVAGASHQHAKSRDDYDGAYAVCMSERGYATTAGAAPPAPAPVVVAPAPVVVHVEPRPVVVKPPRPAAPRRVVVTPSRRPAPRRVAVPAPRSVHVPPGHYPKSGLCRVWHPGRPPGQQPKPFRCRPVSVPAGAFILYDGVAWDGDYDWRAHARRRPGSVPRVIVEMSARR
jgi:hypothetical protein